MSEKVKLTREQEFMFKNHKGAFETLMRKHHMENCPTVIDELTTQQVVDAYFDGYEVEETFEVEDTVILNSGKVVEILEEGWGPHAVVVGWIANGSMYRDMIDKSVIDRHATKQEVWWASHGRRVLEFKTNDITSVNLPTWCGIYVVNADRILEDAFGNELVQVNGDEGEILSFRASELKVICFAEDRKDV